MVPCDYGWEPDHQVVMITRTVPNGTDLHPSLFLGATVSVRVQKLNVPYFVFAGARDLAEAL